MKKATKIIITAALISSMNLTALAAEIPGESVPVNATNESIALTENLISGILFEVENGLGYADAQAQAQNIIFNAVIAGPTNGYGYADLMAMRNTFRNITACHIPDRRFERISDLGYFRRHNRWCGRRNNFNLAAACGSLVYSADSC